MKVLYLGPYCPLTDFLVDYGETVEMTGDPITDFGNADFVVSYGYRHIIKNDAELQRMRGRAINLHISYLPWNRGADPNLWSWVDDTPKGVSIHYIDKGLDTGDLIAREIVAFGDDETLATSYAKLRQSMASLFIRQWTFIRRGDCNRSPQIGEGSYHRSTDKEHIAHLLPDGWQTKISVMRGLMVRSPGR